LRTKIAFANPETRDTGLCDASAMRVGSLADVDGISVGHVQRIGNGWLTGTTVVLGPPDGLIAAVDVRGGGPATHETDALDPTGVAPRAAALVLTGGSAYGLATTAGVVRFLEKQRRGFRVGPEPHQIVPVVPGAALFDLGRGGDFAARPDADMGYEAALAAASGSGGGATGCVGAGTGAVAGGIKGGLGTASTTVADGVVVAAVIAVNSLGSPVHMGTGALLGAAYGEPDEFPATPPAAEHAAAITRMIDPLTGATLHTSIGVVATTADLTRPETKRLAMASHDGLARAVRPSHTMFDGDLFFAVATCAHSLPLATEEGFADQRARALTAIHAAAADTVTRAVAHAVLDAYTVAGIPAYRDLYPSAARV
jgi:putative pantetheine hydrolase